MRNRIAYILLSIILVLSVPYPLVASNRYHDLKADSIMRLIMRRAPVLEDIVKSYEASAYVKGKTHVPKSNRLLKYGYLIFPVAQHPDDAIFEMDVNLRYDAPNYYRNEIKAINSSRPGISENYQEVCGFVNLNIYAPTIFKKGMITPISKDAFKYYDFKIVQTNDSKPDHIIYTIQFTPRQWSQKLLSGTIDVVDRYWIVERIRMSGHSSLSEFQVDLDYMQSKKFYMLIKNARLRVAFHVLGNRIENDIEATLKYKRLTWADVELEEEQKRSLDKTQYYTISDDTISFIRDSTYWNNLRGISLTAEEKVRYAQGAEKLKAKKDTSAMDKYLQLGGQLTSTMNMDYKSTRVKYSGLLNPFQLSFTSDGLNYRQEVRISKTFDKDRQLRFHPSIGFLFRDFQVRLKVATEWEYFPEKQGVLSLTFGNENQSYSSDIIDKINEILKDSLPNFEEIQPRHFHHYFVKLNNDIEIAHGLKLATGLEYHLRTPMKKNKDSDRDMKNHNEFTPVIGLSYTPRQYYWMDGYRKEYLHSYFPTMRLEIAHCFPKVFHSTGNYWRMEAGLNQCIKLGLSKRLHYNVSGGLFFNQRNTYFADFSFFEKHFFPEAWGDQFGGTFHNLDEDWYHASEKYFQAHFMYESPFILFRFIKPTSKVHKYLTSERFYFSQLWTPVIKNYNEWGYGIGNDILNLGLFVGFQDFKYENFGVKFALELFR